MTRRSPGPAALHGAGDLEDAEDSPPSTTRLTPSDSSGVAAAPLEYDLPPPLRVDEDAATAAKNRGAIRDWDDGGRGRDVEQYEMDEFRPEDASSGGEDDGDGDGAGPSARRRSRRAASVATAESFQLYTPDMERAVVRKFDRRLVLFVALLYMLSFLDRSNIGNARIAGMDADLQTSPPWPDWYDWSLTAFYIAYIAFEWMSLLWRVIPAHIYVSMIVLSWGVTASLQAIATSYPMLVALRFLLGIGEAGFTGIPFYLSFFFKRDELAFRTAIFVSAAPLATTFASSLAWLIIKLGRGGPIAPWRLLFLVEGFPSVLIAAVAWSVIPDSPETASYLTPEERKVAFLRMRHENPSAASSRKKKQQQQQQQQQQEHADGSPNSKARETGRDLLRVLADPAAWLTASMFFLTNMAYSSLPVFLPTILTQMGHDALAAQALAAPPYLAAFLIVLATAHVSDRTRQRSLLVAAHALASAAGYALLALLPPGASKVLRYVAVYPAAVGFFNVVVLLIAWTINNQPGEGRRGGAFALFQLVGQCGPLVGTRLYPQADAPLYQRGMRVMAVAMLGVAVLAVGLRFYLVRLNRRADAAAGRSDETDDIGAEEEEGLVGKGKRGREGKEGFRYML